MKGGLGNRGSTSCTEEKQGKKRRKVTSITVSSKKWTLICTQYIRKWVSISNTHLIITLLQNTILLIHYALLTKNVPPTQTKATVSILWGGFKDAIIINFTMLYNIRVNVEVTRAIFIKQIHIKKKHSNEFTMNMLTGKQMTIFCSIYLD